MIQSRTPQYIKLDEHKHVEKLLFEQLDGLGWGIIHLIQDLLTGKKRVTPLLTEPQEAGA